MLAREMCPSALEKAKSYFIVQKRRQFITLELQAYRVVASWVQILATLLHQRLLNS